MTLFGRLSRAFVLGGMLTGAMMAPAVAAQSDIALLESYIGTYKGTGELVGADAETVVCRMTLAAGNAGKVNYTGRCSLAGNQMAVHGTIAYITDKRRFEAAMTSNAAFSGLAIGQVRGDTIVFNLREKEQDDTGKTMTISSAIILSGGLINVDFSVVFDTGEKLTAKIPFTK